MGPRFLLGGYLATSDTLQGLIAQGRTIAETIEIAQDVAKKLIESYIEHGESFLTDMQKATMKSGITLIQKEELQSQIIPVLIFQKGF